MADQTEQTHGDNASGKQHFCAHCGTENAKNGYACNRCGERLIEVTSDGHSPIELISCARCGSAGNARATYCWVCGTEMKDAVRISPTPREPEPAQTRSQTTVQAPESPSARTYRPDLNPISTPTTDSPGQDRIGEQDDLRRSSGDIDAQQAGLDGQFGPDSASSNTSGTKNSEIPPGVSRWNWAAFLMPAVWGLFSGVPYTVLLFGAVLLPTGFQLIVMTAASLFLGFKGNELAWRGKKWRSVEHFRSFQKQWSSWAVKLTIAAVVILVVLGMMQGDV
jgi:hypothetical protein